MTTGKMDRNLIQVPMSAKQVRQIQELCTWVEPSIWTLRMLTALLNGVKGGKWYSLRDKVYAQSNLYAAFQKVKANKGRGRSWDNLRWPNAYFSKLGLFSLTTARDEACQSARR